VSGDPVSLAHTKATRQDWLDLAMEVLVSDGVEQVKIQPLARRLDVSRSSFYWYFNSRKDLLDALLEVWSVRNTKAILEGAERQSRSIAEAVLNVFAAFLDPALFDPQLDFAVREWSRRDAAIRSIVDEADGMRLNALIGMFRRHGYDRDEAFTRARILYYMQIGYYALEIGETLEERLSYSRDYIIGFTGQSASDQEIREFNDLIRSRTARPS